LTVSVSCDELEVTDVFTQKFLLSIALPYTFFLLLYAESKKAFFSIFSKVLELALMYWFITITTSGITTASLSSSFKFSILGITICPIFLQLLNSALKFGIL